MKTWVASVKFLLLMTVLTGFVYPAILTAFGQVAFPFQSKGSLMTSPSGQVIGSALIGQGFKNPKYFWPRPSAGDFNPMPSGGSNLGPTSKDLANKVKERASQGMTDDLLFASASGLDPHISSKAAMSQVTRVASARGVPEDAVRSMVTKFIEDRQFGILGEPRVNVLRLNLALDER